MSQLNKIYHLKILLTFLLWQFIMTARAQYLCPQYSPPSPNWCKDGLIIPTKPDKQGCQHPPNCLQLEDYYNNLEQARLLGCEAGHIAETRHKEAYFSSGILSIPYVGVDFTPGSVLEVQFQLAEDGQWNLINTKPGSSGVKAVKFGRYTGECLGYCWTEILITAKTITLKKSHWQNLLPEITMKNHNTEKEWNSLIKLIDYPAFESLPLTLGCPDCADQGGYFIEIYYEERHKRIDLAAGTGLDTLFAALNEILTNQESALMSDRTNF